MTGSSGEIGQRLVARFARDPDYELVAGLDVRAPSTPPAGFAFHRLDIRAPLQSLLRDHRIDTVVHGSFIVQPIHDTALREDVNVGGDANLLRACSACRVQQIVHLSSATVYGFHPETRAPFRETDPVRPGNPLLYAEYKRRVEEMLASFADASSPHENPDCIVTVLRPSLIVGRDFENPVMRFFENPVVFIPRRDQPLQMTHVDDLVQIIRLTIKRRIRGVFNVGAEGVMTVEEMIHSLHNRPFEMPLTLLRLLNEALWQCRLTRLAPAPSSALEMLRFPWVVSSRKLMEETGFRYAHSTREAFQSFAGGSLRRRLGRGKFART